ncbi:MAG: trypsin-like peptidase domain-containing protein [Exiguobacterium sp.]|nr:trypsin-like peptidase domain-containing protein [Exiguobacterium sp.]MDX5424527.1 trypsin-like peptidase domain-containing protein [Exiguobacterium sp.]MDX6772024.1 trypsin-like peptidase domain-containing protein [Exiguobacterium sp.]
MNEERHHEYEPQDVEPEVHEATEEKSTYPSRSEWRPKQEEHVRHKPRPNIKPLLLGGVGGFLGAALFFLAMMLWDSPTSRFMTNELIRTEQAVTFTESDITTAVTGAKTSVVSITNIQRAFTSNSQWEAGAGSGVIYKVEDDTAYIVTNFHVIEQADEISIAFSDGQVATATVLGEDPLNDLAVAAVELPDNIEATPIVLGDSTTLQAGETVMAIGNPLGVFSNSVTRGIVSGVERTVPVDTNSDGLMDYNAEVIQTDAAINPGNSGGALINIRGELVGINSMKIAEASVEGVGFSIPVNVALPVIDMLERDGRVTRAQLGVTIQEVIAVPGNVREEYGISFDNEDGVFVEEITPGSPAEQAGLQVGDVIVKIGDREIKRYVDLRDALYRDATVGDTVTIEYTRRGERNETEATLTEAR